ncbi:MAG TPA: EAL domain-containing protein [Woeseiaceae bacterium]|nr:EAL domain-containing protein [Woeseiaceae bacterium]
MLLTIVPLAVAQLVTMFAVMQTVESNVDTTARESLVAGGEIVAEYLASHGEQLRTSVEVMALDFGLKEAVATGDEQTISSVLENHSARVNADIASLVDLDGQLIANSVSAPVFPLHHLSEIETTAVLDGTAYHVFVVPLKAPLPIAWVVIGFRIDDALASRIAALTGLEVTIVSSRGQDARVMLSTSPRYEYNMPAHEVFANEELLTMPVSFIADRPDTVVVVLQRSIAEAMLPYVEARRGLFFFTIALLAFVAIGAVLFSTTIARPLRSLADAAQRIISGNYDGDIAVQSKDEFGQLASSFNAMRLAISEREQRISHQATHDDLTDLPNRAKVLKYLTRLIEGAGKESISVLSLRIARLEEISSTLGHKASDELIVQAARHLNANLGDGDLLGHTGTNEFTLILPGCPADEALMRVERIEHILGAGVTLNNTDIALQTEIGIAEFPRHGSNAADLLRFATIACTDAGQSSDRVRTYEAGREDEFVRRLRVVNDLRAAIRHREIHVWYQPKASLKEGDICGVEALVRWYHPELGFLSPDEFIPATEQAGTIVHLTRYVLTEAVKQCRHWLDFGFEMGMSVNLSARDLTDEYLPYHVLQILKDNDVKPGYLTLEITESSIMEDLGRSLLVLECLRDVGVRISIDDFGTGHSSLAQLKNIPVHELKVDKSFIFSICEEKENEAIVRATIELAHSLGLDVVAEGVEDEETMRRVTRLGAEVAQGYFLSKPVPPETLTKWLMRYTPTVYPDRRKSDRAFA